MEEYVESFVRFGQQAVPFDSPVYMDACQWETKIRSPALSRSNACTNHPGAAVAAMCIGTLEDWTGCACTGTAVSSGGLRKEISPPPCFSRFLHDCVTLHNLSMASSRLGHQHAFACVCD